MLYSIAVGQVIGLVVVAFLLGCWVGSSYRRRRVSRSFERARVAIDTLEGDSSLDQMLEELDASDAIPEDWRTADRTLAWCPRCKAAGRVREDYDNGLLEGLFECCGWRCDRIPEELGGGWAPHDPDDDGARL